MKKTFTLWAFIWTLVMTSPSIDVSAQDRVTVPKPATADQPDPADIKNVQQVKTLKDQHEIRMQNTMSPQEKIDFQKKNENQQTQISVQQAQSSPRKDEIVPDIQRQKRFEERERVKRSEQEKLNAKRKIDQEEIEKQNAEVYQRRQQYLDEKERILQARENQLRTITTEQFNQLSEERKQYVLDNPDKIIVKD